MSKVSLFTTGYARCAHLHQQFLQRVQQQQLPSPSSVLLADVGLSPAKAIQLFSSQLTCRHLDYTARKLKKDNKSYYTIGSAGHECSAAIAAAFRLTDMAFLHYRSGAFMLQRAYSLPELDPIKDMLASLMALKLDPIAQGRHKVFGHAKLYVPPQTSTIASHLPKALGTAVSIKRAQTLKLDSPLPHDSVVLCSFGDASVNHAVALSAFNTAEWIVRHYYPLPMVFICEDNGLGVSVKTPPDWIERQYSNRPYLQYLCADGHDFLEVYAAAKKAEKIARYAKKPVFLHVKCVRLLGHAGVDYELDYRLLEEVLRDEDNDPLLYSASTLINQAVMTAKQIVALDQKIQQQIDQTLDRLLSCDRLSSAEEVMSSIIPPDLKQDSPPIVDQPVREKCFASRWPETAKPINMSQQLNLALIDILLQYRNAVVFGEDVALKGGVYTVTKGLLERFGPARVFDTLLDETTILGHAIGHAHNGFIPIPEIQFLAYVHNAEDQLRGEAATLPFFSSGQYANPMVVRIASFAYQKGFGGHFHNENSFNVFRDIPGIIVACPSNGVDAAKMLRHCVQLAAQQQRVVIFLEPIALYMQKDLHQQGDGLWLGKYSDPAEQIVLGEMAVYGNKADVAIITYGNGFFLTRKAEKILLERGIKLKIIDLRWLNPIDYVQLEKQIEDVNAILIVDECRQTGSLSEALIANLCHLRHKKINRLCAKDSFISLGESWRYLLPDEKDIVAAVESLLQ